MTYRRLSLLLAGLGAGTFALVFAQACSSNNNPDNGLDGGGGGGDTGSIITGDGCSGVRCQIPTCQGGGTTSLSGTVFDPAGKNPLYNAIVYVPNSKPKAFPKGVQCDKCGTTTGDPIVTGLTDTKGHFSLQGVPAGANIPLVIQIGKWRRQVVIPSVASCADTVAPADLTRLPKNQSEGDLPQIALVTGAADPIECLLRKIGLEDKEFTGSDQSGRVHMYQGYGGSTVAVQYDAKQLWLTPTSLDPYDIVLLGCEGATHPENKPATALQYMSDYANKGGRILASHYHYYWFLNGPAPLPTTATYTADQATFPASITATIDTTFPKGQAFSDWLVNVGGSTTPGQITINQARDNVSTVNTQTSQRWIYDANPQSVQYLTFNTPVGTPADQQCGRVSYNDVHVASGDTTSIGFPAGCVSTDMSAQEKALEFMLFDLSSCVQTDQKPPQPPR